MAYSVSPVQETHIHTDATTMCRFCLNFIQNKIHSEKKINLEAKEIVPLEQRSAL